MREVAMLQLVRQAPMDSAAVADRARRMAADGLGVHDIATALRTHPAQISRWLTAIDHTEAAAMHVRVWTNPNITE